uniref:Rho related BTB domain containing 3 n=1 Tax=Taeniopygia guttata TaxID=59729 RepID=H0YS63_TAEGU
MSVNIVAFGNERDGFSEDNQQPSLIWSYLGRSALISQIDSSLSASHVGNPVFTEYQACVFGNVRLVVHDYPVWNGLGILFLICEAACDLHAQFAGVTGAQQRVKSPEYK